MDHIHDLLSSSKHDVVLGLLGELPLVVVMNIMHLLLIIDFLCLSIDTIYIYAICGCWLLV
jgi:hypothetical protein